MADDDRNQRVLQLFLAGANYAQIASAVDMDIETVHDLVCQELKRSEDRRTVLSDEARAVYQERSEALFRAHFAPALRGDHKSAEICRRILETQARVFASETQADQPKDDQLDELAKLRARRA